ncbi:hypothetical protein [Hymenobacter negativus]|uniref:Uncharacterized protein n=1 Tax=Hymenobacter negativus TaxID=2795026 RepID=A0ABS3QA08_9BACT|nr:hypothetical protein [Hymenobacter negativus]MBO2008084.1 hypothetical protein [Hymenobacter negativus]
MLTETQRQLLAELQQEVQSHGLQSGEIILELSEVAGSRYAVEPLLVAFFSQQAIRIFPEGSAVSEITYQQAVASMKYGLSSKINYTRINREFSPSDQNRIVHSFLRLFDKPRFYSTSARIYRANLDLEDFWESGGAIVIDEHAIGILWENDLYAKFR